MEQYNMDKHEIITDFSIISFLCVILIVAFTTIKKEDLYKTSELFPKKTNLEWNHIKITDFSNFFSQKVYANYGSFLDYFTAIENLRTRLTSYLNVPNQNFRRIIDALIETAANNGPRVQRLRTYFQNVREDLEHSARQLMNREENNQDIERAEKLWKEIESLIAAICARYEETSSYTWAHPWWFYLIYGTSLTIISVCAIRATLAIESIATSTETMAKSSQHIKDNINNVTAYFNAIRADFWRIVMFWGGLIGAPINFLWHFIRKK